MNDVVIHRNPDCGTSRNTLGLAVPEGSQTVKGRPVEIDLVGPLAQPFRLEAFKLLAARGAAGLPAGAIAERLNLAPSALSFHLIALQRAGLVQSWRVGQHIYYAADTRQSPRATRSKSCAPSRKPTACSTIASEFS